jgi:N-acetylmuramoyl-L-alanine amidase
LHREERTVKENRIFIDPGHGGRDPGAVHPSGDVTEAMITHAAAAALGQALRLMRYDVMFTPAVGLPNSEVVRGHERARYANHNGAALFVSLHCNASLNRKGRGTECWYFSHEELAAELSRACSLGQDRNRGAKRSSELSVLTRTHMPAVLLEMAFVDNDEDCQWLLRHWPAQMGAAAMVIHDWMQRRLK